MFISKYHLPHNSIRIDEFNFMLSVIDKSKNYYLYKDLKILFFYEEVLQQKFEKFHSQPHFNLLNHSDKTISEAYKDLIHNPSIIKAANLLECQYTSKKTLNQVWNEFVRDYTEYFAFLGLLPTYYKGLVGDSDKKHYISERLKSYCNGALSLRELILNLKYRNASKNNDSIEMYNIKVRPFVIALNVLRYYYNKGFKYIDPHILSAIVIYSSKEDDYIKFCKEISNPMLTLADYKKLFFIPNGKNEASFFESTFKEIGRATLLLKPYLENIGVVKVEKIGRTNKYKPISSAFHFETIAKKSVYCNDTVGNLKLTPLIGKVINFCYTHSQVNKDSTYSFNDIFDNNYNYDDKLIILKELKNLGVVKSFDNDKVILFSKENQLAINPYTEFFNIEDADYVNNIKYIKLEDNSQIVLTETTQFDDSLKNLESIAYGSNGPLYEASLFKIINDNFDMFKNKKWYGAAATGKRISDIAFTVDIYDNTSRKKILVIIECKAGNAIRSFDERKEIDDVEGLLKIYPEKHIDGIWYWVVNGNSLPNYDEHGGYRVNAYSKNLLQKLNDIQFEVSEFSRMPTIITAFSYNAICEYLRYIYINANGKDVITPYIVPHFWRWSKKFMNLQYVMIHKELNIGV